LKAAAFEPDPSYVWPGAPLAAFAAPAEGPSLPPPAIDVIDRKTTSVDRSVTLRARSQRGSRVLSVHFPTGRGVTVAFAGHSATAVRIGGHQVFVCLGVPASGIEIHVTVVGSEPWSGLLVDHLPGLPAAGSFLEQARGNSAVAAHFGDDTLASMTLRL